MDLLYKSYSDSLSVTIVKLYLLLQAWLVDSTINFSISTDPNDIHLYLHPLQENPNYRIELLSGDASRLKECNFISKSKTIFLIHGFISNSVTHMPVIIRNEYLRSGLNCNVITVDWGLLSLPDSEPSPGSLSLPSIPVILESFPVVVQNIPLVARIVAEYIEFIIRQQFANISQIHLVGHSLGAHLSGVVGYNVQRKFEGQRLGRISGLDPSGPTFQFLPLQMVLDKGDADFVDVYHTNMGILGYLGKMGHIDFYPNGGRFQPGCFAESICSHNIAVEVYAVTINRVVNACKCENFKDWGWTINCSCDDNDNEGVVRAGEFLAVEHGVRGQFYYTTSPNVRLCKPFEFNC